MVLKAKSDRHLSQLSTRILAGVSLLLVIIVILVNLPTLLSKSTVLLAIPYSDTSYVQREVDVFGAEIEALKFVADNTPTDITAAWVSDDYQARDVYVRYWLYPRRIWLSDHLQGAAGQNAGVILVLKQCAADCTAAEIAEPVTQSGYSLFRQFALRENIVTVLIKTS